MQSIIIITGAIGYLAGSGICYFIKKRFSPILPPSLWRQFLFTYFLIVFVLTGVLSLLIRL